MESDPQTRKRVPGLQFAERTPISQIIFEDEKAFKVEEPWMLEAHCKVTDTDMFPSDGVGVTNAQRVCGGCAVRAECLEFALTKREEHGVWGGASEKERRRILRSRRQSK